ncbi:hypothetical protein RN333_00635 [Enterobacter kobei]|uniref:putative T6SS immunity periplasmic lipoprotein n=1 Tax=Enterobacter kobei TaxID=208224 RepID=UPI0028D0A78C|nr:putative T6SS immunity periplasmic lipoprotein [Enterobacter kobei]WNP34793.1 hypothetical protein RN333_00635 [Enterobacter kobei]
MSFPFILLLSLLVILSGCQRNSQQLPNRGAVKLLNEKVCVYNPQEEAEDRYYTYYISDFSNKVLYEPARDFSSPAFGRCLPDFNYESNKIYKVYFRVKNKRGEYPRYKVQFFMNRENVVVLDN